MRSRTTRLARLALCLAALPLAVARAHTHLQRSSPAAGDTLREPPTAVRLWFSGRAELTFTRVRLLGPGGTEIPLDTVARLGSSLSAFTVPIPTALAPGTYAVEWQTAAADGHPVRGRFSFVVLGRNGEPAATLAAADSARPPTPAERLARMPDEEGDELSDYQVARWAGFIAMLAVLGTVVFRFAVVGALERRHEPVADLSERARQIGLGAVVLLLVAGVARLFAELRAVGHPRTTLDLAALLSLLSDTAWGHGWLVGGAGGVVLLGGLVAARWGRGGWPVAAVGAFAVAVSPALTGHAAADPDTPAVSVVVDVLHVLGAGAWLGTLLLVAMAGIPAALRRVPGERGPAAASIVRAFHPIGLVCVPLVLASGLVSAWLRLGSVGALTSSRYGTYLLLKVLIFVCAALMGAYNWRRMLPGLGDEAGARKVRRTASIELALGAIVLAITAALVVTPPPE